MYHHPPMSHRSASLAKLSTRTSANIYPTFLRAICHGDKFGIPLRLKITILNIISTFQHFLTTSFISHFNIDTDATQKNDMPYKRTVAMLNPAVASDELASTKHDNISKVSFQHATSLKDSDSTTTTLPPSPAVTTVTHFKTTDERSLRKVYDSHRENIDVYD
eukprot:CAMPEP_0172498570 /NCGR_PEP_ID=MMETSP1066-20121228/113825_1 /TAXON_ID=671091 /ORGANISM="Coscinodiscus wailesii, Strain CCMP2513" /LENGTH=162 /DNA_ID=CAMNT_0013271885 /DNA_START=84 /DNA_END=569 /DNA_ORIENTATION=-